MSGKAAITSAAAHHAVAAIRPVNQNPIRVC
jgi:hypothetical protein